MSWFYLLMVICVVLIILYGAQKSKELLESGQIIDREYDFYTYSQIFTLKDIDFKEVWEELRIADYHKKASGEAHFEQEIVVYRGSDWSAQLYHMTDEVDRNAYCFEFTKWRRYKGRVVDMLGMNTLLTTVEKTFLKIDPITQVSKKKMEVKTEPRFF